LFLPLHLPLPLPLHLLSSLPFSPNPTICHPVDKPEGSVKCTEGRGPASSRSSEPSVWRPGVTRVLCESFWWSFPGSTSHRYGRNFDHDSFCEHPAFAGCEGAHSSERSGFSRPQDDSGCPRCEPRACTKSGCAASSTAVPPVCAPPPPWPRPLAYCGSDAHTPF
jgi:hypothetical protein